MSASGVSMDQEKVETIMSWERLKLVFKIRSFLGLAGYYKRFIKDFSRLVEPMMKLTRKRSSLNGMTCASEHSRN